jgi:hypothetical protein
VNTGIPGTPILLNENQSLAFVTTETSDATSSQTLVTVIDTQTKAVARTITVAGSPALHDYAIQSNADNTAAVLVTETSGGPDSIRVYATVIDLRTGTALGPPSFLSVGSTARTTSFSPTGDIAVIAIANGPADGTSNTVLAVVDLRTGEAHRFEVDGNVVSSTGITHGVVMGDDGTRAFVFTGTATSTTATVLNLTNPAIIRSAAIDGVVSSVETDAHATLAAVHTTDGAVTIVDAEGRSARSWAPEGATDETQVTFSNDGSRAYLSTVVDQRDPGSPYADYHTIITAVAIGPSGVSVIEKLDVSGRANEPVQVSADGRHAAIMTTTDVFGYTHAIYTIDTGMVSTQVV